MRPVQVSWPFIERRVNSKPMLKGFNSDLNIRGHRYHVQTEDWGRDNPFIVTRVFRDGAVIETFKTPYRDVSLAGLIDGEILQSALKKQHHAIMDKLLSSGN